MIRSLRKVADKVRSIFTYFLDLLARGFYFYFYIFTLFLSKIFCDNKFLLKISNYFKKQQDQPKALLVVGIVSFLIVSSFTVVGFKLQSYDNISEEILNSVENNNKNTQKIGAKDSLFKKYSNVDIDKINFNNLRLENRDVVVWLKVNNTNINYPIVKALNNEFYLENNFLREKSYGGWPFMDYRNSGTMDDSNTIFYGNGSINDINFGSLAQVFTEEWFKKTDHTIIILTEDKKYLYKIFSSYYIDDTSGYLQNNFYKKSEYKKFLKEVKRKSKFNYREKVKDTDKIITLATSINDNNIRRVVHAVLIESNNLI